MRSATIIASLALTLLAAPLPTSENLAPARRAFIENSTPVEARTSRNRGGGRTIWARDVREEDVSEVEKRGFRPVHGQTRPTRGRRSVPLVEDEEGDISEVEKRRIRPVYEQTHSMEGRRSVPSVEDEEGTEELNKRAVKDAGKHGIVGLGRNRHAARDEPHSMESRYVRENRRSVPLGEDEGDVTLDKRILQGTGKHARSAEDEAGLSERAIKQGGKDTRSVEDEEDVELGRRLLKIGGKNSRSVDEEDVELGKRIL